MTETSPRTGAGVSDRGGQAGASGLARGLCVALGVMFAPTGLQAAFVPRSFYDDFPLGRGWIPLTAGHYDEHLVRDVGGLFLALVVLSVWSWWRPALCLPVAVAWFGQGVFHLVFHLRHLDGIAGVDRIGLVGSLVAAPVVAAVAIIAARR